jgi:hypothetical protein
VGRGCGRGGQRERRRRGRAQGATYSPPPRPTVCAEAGRAGQASGLRTPQRSGGLVGFQVAPAVTAVRALSLAHEASVARLQAELSVLRCARATRGACAAVWELCVGVVGWLTAERPPARTGSAAGGAPLPSPSPRLAEPAAAAEAAIVAHWRQQAVGRPPPAGGGPPRARVALEQFWTRVTLDRFPAGGALRLPLRPAAPGPRGLAHHRGGRPPRARRGAPGESLTFTLVES